MKKILAIDFGERRIGIAISDNKHTFAFPRLTIDTEKNSDVFQKIKSIIIDNDIGKVVIGNPVQVDGDDSKKSQQIKNFSKKLKKFIDIPIVFWDESYTTEKAKKILHKSTKSFKENKDKLDQIAASLILEDYLKSN